MADQRIRVLVAGDTVGEPGRRACREFVPRLRKNEKIDFVIVNGENLAGGSGITQGTAAELFEAGVDVITSGDHYFDKREAFDYLAREPRILRPLNYPTSAPGHGSVIIETAKGRVGVINLLGRVFIHVHVEDPFTRVLQEIDKMKKETPVIIIDIHAEATSEKIALSWYLDGKVSALFGTHTHVQTSDERVLPKGTGYITDAGMTGPYESVLGRDIQAVLSRFVTQVPTRFPVAEGDVRFSGAIFEIDTVTGKAISVDRVHERLTT